MVTARKHVKRSLAAAHTEALVASYESLSPAPGTPFSTDGEAMGRRALRNVVLDYLNTVEGPARAKAQAIPSPIPEFDPVITAFFPERSMVWAMVFSCVFCNCIMERSSGKENA